jgi:hypothetical protein
MRLDATSHSVLEKNLASAKLREFKLAFIVKLTQTATTIDSTLRLLPGVGQMCWCAKRGAVAYAHSPQRSRKGC